MVVPIITCVVGASGFLGREIVSALRRQGYAPVELSVRPTDVNAGAVGEVASYLGQNNVDLVFNCAAARFNGSLRSPYELLRQANVVLPTLLARACARERIPLVHIGSRWQLGEGGEGPNGIYARTKEEGEIKAREVLYQQRVPFTSILIRDTYGVFDPRRTLVNDLLEAAMSGIELPLTTGYQLIDPLPVQRVAESVIVSGASLTQGNTGGRFEVGSHQPPTVRELVELFETSFGCTLNKRWGAMSLRGVELFRMDQVLPWAPGWSPEETRKDFSSFVTDARLNYRLRDALDH